MSQEIRRFLQRYNQTKTNWRQWQSLYNEAYEFAFPNRNPYFQKHRVEGTRKNLNVYDTTLVAAARKLVSSLHKNLVPPSEQWFQLEAGAFVTNPEEAKVLNEQLQNMTDIIWRVMSDSNFDLVINESLADLIIGTMSIQVLDNNDEDIPIRFKSIAPNVIFPEEDAFGEIKSVYRDFNHVHHGDIQRLWPRSELTELMKQAIKDNPDKEFDFIEAVVFDRDQNKFKLVVLERLNNQKILDMEVDQSPWVVARWSKTTVETGGRGPVIQALPTARSVNKLVEFLLQNSALSVNPPWVAFSDGVFNPYLHEIQPNKVIPISRESAGNLPLQKLDVQGQLQFGELEVNDLRAQIKELLFSSPDRPVQAPSQTATEIMLRQQQFLEEIGPAFGRLEKELLPQIINKVISILQKKGFLPEDLKVDNKLVNVRFKSPLAQGPNLQKVQSLQNMVAILQNTVGEQVAFGALNLEELPAWLSDKLDVDEALIRSPAEIQQILQQVQQAQQPQQAEPEGTPASDIFAEGGGF